MDLEFDDSPKQITDKSRNMNGKYHSVANFRNQKKPVEDNFDDEIAKAMKESKQTYK